MPAQLFDVSTGISIDGTLQILYGTIPPALNSAVVLAPLGASYTDTSSGIAYTRKAMLGLVTDWVATVTEEPAIIVKHVGSTGVTLDKISAGITQSFTWEVTATDEAFPINTTSMLVHASHDGTLTVMATKVKHTLSNKIVQGGKIPGLTLEARITTAVGTTVATQNLELFGSAMSPTTFTVIRILKNMAGNTLIASAGASGNALAARALGYDIAGWSAGAVVAQDVLLKVVIPRPVTIPANMAGSLAASVIAPSTPTSFSIRKNDVEFSILSFGVGATAGTYSTCPQQSFIAGDIISIVVMNSDVTMSGIATSLVGNTIDTQAMDIFMWSAATPVAGQIMHLSMIPRTFYLSPSMAGSYASCGTPATATVTYSIQRSGIELNTITFTAGSTVGVFGSCAGEVFNPGSVLSVLPTSSDATLANVTITLAGNIPA